MPADASRAAVRERERATRALPAHRERQELPLRRKAPLPDSGRSPSVEALAACWRDAFDAAESALRAARESLPAAEVSWRLRRLVDERALTLRLLETVARERPAPQQRREASPRLASRAS